MIYLITSYFRFSGQSTYTNSTMHKTLSHVLSGFLDLAGLLEFFRFLNMFLVLVCDGRRDHITAVRHGRMLLLYA